MAMTEFLLWINTLVGMQLTRLSDAQRNLFIILAHGYKLTINCVFAASLAMRALIALKKYVGQCIFV